MEFQDRKHVSYIWIAIVKLDTSDQKIKERDNRTVLGKAL